MSRLFARQHIVRTKFVTFTLCISLLWVLHVGNLSALVKTSDDSLTQATTNIKDAETMPWRVIYELNTNKNHDHRDSPAQDTSARPITSSIPLANGDEFFQQVYNLLQKNQFDKALRIAEDMTNRFPNFQLGSLLYADLLSMKAGLNTYSAQSFTSPQVHRRLLELKAEASQRANRLEKSFLRGKRPSAIAYLSSEFSKIILVDAHKSRLYLLSNENQGISGGRLKVVFDTYASIGQNGIGKWREGDGKTPIGVYFTQKYLKSTILPDLYGSGALTLDYPNPIDKAHKKTGSGIWVHGTPSHQYARPPLSSDGCIVLANDDMNRLIQYGLQSNTPVIIVHTLEWLDDLDEATAAVNTESNAGKPLGSDFPLPSFARRNPSQWKIVSAFQWTDEQQQMAVLSYTHQALGTGKQIQHSYWIKNGIHWTEIVNSPDSKKVNRF